MLLKPILKVAFIVAVVFFTAKSYGKINFKNKDLSAGIVVIGASLLIPAGATYHLLLLLPAVILVIKSFENESKKILAMLLVALICNLMPHHIPMIETSHVLNTLIHFPRLYALLILFILIFILNKKVNEKA